MEVEKLENTSRSCVSAATYSGGTEYGIVYSLQYALVRTINVRMMSEKPEGETVDNRMRTWK